MNSGQFIKQEIIEETDENKPDTSDCLQTSKFKMENEVFIKQEIEQEPDENEEDVSATRDEASNEVCDRFNVELSNPCYKSEIKLNQSGNFKRPQRRDPDKKSHSNNIDETKTSDAAGSSKGQNTVNADEISHSSASEKTSNQFGDLKGQKIIHNGEKPHSCDVCDKPTEFNDQEEPDICSNRLRENVIRLMNEDAKHSNVTRDEASNELRDYITIELSNPCDKSEIKLNQSGNLKRPQRRHPDKKSHSNNINETKSSDVSGSSKGQNTVNADEISHSSASEKTSNQSGVLKGKKKIHKGKGKTS
ncbi:unnamed protein product [Leptidea sinapis]|uniref:Uncharacterized protein n=1 Tax=Leptidea sinapis TaxID=189913 RepID=A0A5E4QAL6_9NEOP|nr:unnamed protein product [Leptidea sinapis]